MAITKLTDPSALPTTTADYQAQNNAINYHTLNMTPPYPVSSGSVLKGSVFNIGGDLYYTGADTAVTGTTSDYVQLDPGSAGSSVVTATYETATNMTANVTWSDSYNGYYDSSGNLYLFDEQRAKGLAVISSTETALAKVYSNTMEYQYVIDSSAKLDALADMTSGSLINILVKAGTWTLTSGKVVNLGTVGCKKLIGETGAIIETAVSSTTDIIIGYTSRPTTDIELYLIYNICINTTGSSTYTVSNCNNIRNCKVDSGYVRGCVNVFESSADLFWDCDNLYNCYASIFALCNYLYSCIGADQINANYDTCKYLISCKSNRTNTSGMGSVFSLCEHLSMCYVIGSITSVATSTVACFKTCKHLTDCGCDLSSAPGSWYIFNGCSYVYAPDVTNKSSAGDFTSTTGANTNGLL